MRVVIRNFERGDLGKIETAKPVNIDRDANHYAGMEEFGRTMFEADSDQPIAAWGIQPHWEGVATVWSEFSELALTKYPLAVAKGVKRNLEEHIKSLDLHRVQSMIYAGDAVSIHWIEWLGFHCEGRMEQYVKGVDVLMYARLVD
jgi:hypothetical protein